MEKKKKLHPLRQRRESAVQRSFSLEQLFVLACVRGTESRDKEYSKDSVAGELFSLGERFPGEFPESEESLDASPSMSRKIAPVYIGLF